MPVVEPDLWSLTRGAPEIDPDRLAGAVEREALSSEELDFRTRLLIRDSLDALARRWGEARLTGWLGRSPARERLARIRAEELGSAGFPSLGQRLMEQTRPETVLQFLRELGSRLHRLTQVHVGGSAALIVVGKLSRHTEDVGLVDQVPAELRAQHDVLAALAQRYGLRLAHFQSHFLPAGWQGRVQSLGRMGNLEVHLVDAYDIFLGKLFSGREKDRDDLRSESRLREAATANWYILNGDPLPS